MDEIIVKLFSLDATVREILSKNSGKKIDAEVLFMKTESETNRIYEKVGELQGQGGNVDTNCVETEINGKKDILNAKKELFTSCLKDLVGLLSVATCRSTQSKLYVYAPEAIAVMSLLVNWNAVLNQNDSEIYDQTKTFYNVMIADIEKHMHETGKEATELMNETSQLHSLLDTIEKERNSLKLELESRQSSIPSSSLQLQNVSLTKSLSPNTSPFKIKEAEGSKSSSLNVQSSRNKKPDSNIPNKPETKSTSLKLHVSESKKASMLRKPTYFAVEDDDNAEEMFEYSKCILFCYLFCKSSDSF